METCGFPEIDWPVPPAKFMSTRLRKRDRSLASKNKVRISTVLNDSGRTKEPQFPLSKNGVKVSHSDPLVEYTRLCTTEAVPALPPPCESRVLLRAPLQGMGRGGGSHRA